MQKIAKNISHLRQLRKLTQEQFADELNITRSRVSSYEEGRSAPPIEMLIRFSDYFKLPVDVLIKHDLTKAESESFIDIGGQRILFPIMVSEDNRDLIEVVPIKASAGYLAGYSDPEYIENLQKMKLPFMPAGKYRAFPIIGDSMLPLKSGSYIVGKFIENLSGIKNGKTYILITRTEGIVYKRVYNKIEEDGTLHLHSDNKIYASYKINAKEILEVWEFTCQINTQEYAEDELSMDNIFSMLRELKVELAALVRN